MFRTSIPLGRVAGIRLGAHWSVVIVLGLLTYLLAAGVFPVADPGAAPASYWAAGAVTAVCFLLALLAHELAHALVARHFGVATKQITLWMLGGAAELDGEPPHPRADFAIAAAGPAVSAVIGGTCWALAVTVGATLPPLIAGSLLWIGLTNVVLAAFNLLPGAPLDGGRLLRAAVWWRTRDRQRAARAAARTGQVLGALLAAAGFAEVLFLAQLSGLWLALIGWFLIGAATTERTQAELTTRLAGMAIRDVMVPDRPIAPGWFTVQAFLDGVATTSRERLFPVVSFEGAPLGVLALTELARLDPAERLTTRIADACRTPPSVALAPADTPVTDVLGRVPLRPGRDLILVTEDGTLAGTVSADDLTRVLELAALRRP